MVHVSAKASSFLKIGVVLFCFMCLFFATYMASRYEHEKTKTEIQTDKVKELEEKYQELSIINQELLQTQTVLIQEKAQMAQEIEVLRAKTIEFEDWKHPAKKEISGSTASPGDQSIPDEMNMVSDVKEDLATGQLPSSAFTDQIQAEEDSAGTQTGNAIDTQPPD